MKLTTKAELVLKVNELEKERDDLYDSAVSMLNAFPLDPGDWPVDGGEDAVAALRRWFDEGSKPDEWGDDIPANSIVGMIVSGGASGQANYHGGETMKFSTFDYSTVQGGTDRFSIEFTPETSPGSLANESVTVVGYTDWASADIRFRNRAHAIEVLEQLLEKARNYEPPIPSHVAQKESGEVVE